MTRKIKLTVMVLVTAVLCTVGAELLFTRVESASQRCWQVDCNTCCKSGNGPVVCTQRACV